MKLKLVITAALLTLASLSAFADVEGTWEGERKSDGRLHLSMSFGKHSRTGQTYRIADFEGLGAAQIAAATSTPVTFRLRREAGTITFNGTFDDGEGSGRFTFEPDRSFESRIRSLGVDSDDALSERELFHLALFDVSSQYIADLRAAGVGDLDLDELIGARIHRVSADLIREYRALNIGEIDLDEAMALSIHRVTPEYVREMAQLGFRADADELVAMKIHRVSPEFIQEMRALGYTRLDGDDFVAMAIHRVDSDFVRELSALGYRNVSSDDLVAMRIHGVTPEYIREQNAAAGEKLSIDELLENRILKHHKRGKRR